MTHPFPLPRTPQAEWSAKDYQAAANHCWYEIMGVDRTEPNYRPLLSMLEAAHRDYTNKARMARANKEA